MRGDSPLAQLNAYIRGTVQARAGEPAPGEVQDPHELFSARRFRQAWERGRTLDRVDQALARRPANAGPLNSHALVLQSLALMRELSPEYLRRFLAHVEALQSLEQAVEKAPRDAGKPPRRSRTSRPPPRAGADPRR